MENVPKNGSGGIESTSDTNIAETRNVLQSEKPRQDIGVESSQSALLACTEKELENPVAKALPPDSQNPNRMNPRRGVPQAAMPEPQVAAKAPVTGASIGRLDLRSADPSEDKPFEIPADEGKRSGVPDFREVLEKGLAICRRSFSGEGIFPDFVNLLKIKPEWNPEKAERQARASGPGEQTSDKSGKKGGAASGGAGGGGGSTPLHQRSGDPDFRDVLGEGLAICRRSLITVGIFSLFVNLLILAIPIYLFQISDRVLTSRSIDTLVMLTVIVVGALAVHSILDMLRRVILMRIAVLTETRLGAPVLSAAVKISNPVSNKEFQALSDLQQLRNFITGPMLLQMFDAPIAPVFFLIVYMIHPHLGAIITSAGLLLFVVAMINQRLTAVPFARANAYSMRANYHAEALSRNAQVINAMGMTKEGVLVWGRETAESLKAQVIAQDRNIIMAGISKFVRLVTQISLLGWGANLALSGHLTGGMIIAASIIGSRALAPVEGTIEGWRSFVQARSAFARIKQLLKSSPLNVVRLRLPRPQGRLSVERILYVPPPTKKVILNGITFSLRPGESLAIVGPSGTGKSTLARMLVGSLIPTAGNVRLDEMDIRTWDSRQFGESVGYLPQDIELFPASIKANIARMRDDVSDESVYNAAELAGVHEMIAELPQGYETQIAMDGSPLSGGQKQRIALARAFFGNPILLVLDEPNSNLDTHGENALATALVRAKQKKITVIMVTQRPSILSSVDKIMMLKQGAVHAFGKRDDIIAKLTVTKTTKSNGALASGLPANGSARKDN